MSALGLERGAAGRQVAVLVAAYGAVVLWGATPLATKVAVAGLDPLAVGLLRTLLAGIVALPLIFLGRVKPPRSGRSTHPATGGAFERPCACVWHRAAPSPRIWPM